VVRNSMPPGATRSLFGDPRCIATTTPRAVPLVRRLAGGDAIVTQSPSAENADNLAPGFLQVMQESYGGSLLGRQELDGELIEDAEGAQWRRSDIDRYRVWKAPERYDDIIIAVDPPITSGRKADMCGIIALARAQAEGFGERCFVLADGSVQGLRPLDWGARVVTLAETYGASSIVAEANQGGEMVQAVLESAGCARPIRLVRAKLGKEARAAPVAALYERGSVAHVGILNALEDQMCVFGTDSLATSPDRVDALVWGVTTLMLGRAAAPRVRTL